MIYFIVNPAAGAGRAKAAVPLIEKAMLSGGYVNAGGDANGDDARANRNGADGRNGNSGYISGSRGNGGYGGAVYSIIYTDKPDDSDRVSSLIDLDAAKAIICVGGDGTVQEYVGLAIENGVNFGVIPAGCANDLLLSIPECKKRFRSFADKITYYTNRVIQNETIPLDAVLINRERYFINISGTGLDIQVLQDALPLKKYINGAAYFLALLKNMFTYKATEMTLTIDGRPETGEYILMAVCNGAYYGGNIQVAPKAVPNDGMLTFCKVVNMNKLKIAAMIFSIKPGWHSLFKEVTYVNCSNVKLEFKGKRIINLDGNLIGYESPLLFEIVKNAVNLII